MPGKLKAFYKEKIWLLEERRKQVPKVNILNPQATYADFFDHVTRMSELAYEQNGIRNSIVRLLGDNANDRQTGNKAVQDIVGRFSQLPQLNDPEEPRHEIIAEEGRQIIP